MREDLGSEENVKFGPVEGPGAGSPGIPGGFESASVTLSSAFTAVAGSDLGKPKQGPKAVPSRGSKVESHRKINSLRSKTGVLGKRAGRTQDFGPWTLDLRLLSAFDP